MDNVNTQPERKLCFAGTFNGRAVGCSAALATIEIMEKQRVHKHHSAWARRCGRASQKYVIAGRESYCRRFWVGLPGLLCGARDR